MEYGEVKKLAGEYRREIVPMLKKLGFNASVTSKRHYWKNEINVTIKKVPDNFNVWTNKYNHFNLMDKAKKLKNTIENRMEGLFGTTGIVYNVNFHGNIPFKEYEGYTGG